MRCSSSKAASSIAFWAMEALRVRAVANSDVVGQFGLTLDDYELRIGRPRRGNWHDEPLNVYLDQTGFVHDLPPSRP